MKNLWSNIPVFPGTNSEYDSAKAFEKEGAEVNLVPFVTLHEEAIVKSVETMVDNIGKANILFFAGGFSAADEPDGSAKFIVNILLNEKVRAAPEAARVATKPQRVLRVVPG